MVSPCPSGEPASRAGAASARAREARGRLAQLEGGYAQRPTLGETLGFSFPGLMSLEEVMLGLVSFWMD